AIGKIFVAAEESSSVRQSSKRTRDETWLILNAESNKRIVLIRKLLVYTGIEVVSRFAAYRIRQKVIAARLQSTRSRMWWGQRGGWGIQSPPARHDRGRGNDIERLSRTII